MANQVVALNQTDVSVIVRILNNTDGTPNTGITNSTTGLDIFYQRDANTVPVSGGVSTNDLGSETASHNDWGLIHLIAGYYRVDLPNAAFAEGAGFVLCGVVTDAHTGVAVTVVIEPLYKFQGQASSVTALTTTFPASTDPYKGDYIYVTSGVGIKQMVLITSVAGQVATHEAWPGTNISATTSTILLVSGQGDIMSDGGINADALSSDAATPAEVDTSLATVGLDTISTELGVVDTNVDAIKVKTDELTFTIANELDSNTHSVNDIEIDGSGTELDPFGPA